MTDEHRAALFSDNFRRELQGYHASAVFHEHAAQAQTDHPLSLVQYLDLKTFLVSILHKVDRASMAHALEVRVPLLDHQLVEWLATLPPAWKLHGHDGKHLLKKAMEPHLPHRVMYRPKRGFSVPLASWFRGPLRERLRAAVLGPTLAETGLFDTACLQELVDRHQSGRRDNSAMLWELLMYASFVERTLGH
jgi:asparagine synthase (glutamine-hydrolysing)